MKTNSIFRKLITLWLIVFFSVVIPAYSEGSYNSGTVSNQITTTVQPNQTVECVWAVCIILIVGGVIAVIIWLNSCFKNIMPPRDGTPPPPTNNPTSNINKAKNSSEVIPLNTLVTLNITNSGSY